MCEHSLCVLLLPCVCIITNRCVWVCDVDEGEGVILWAAGISCSRNLKGSACFCLDVNQCQLFWLYSLPGQIAHTSLSLSLSVSLSLSDASSDFLFSGELNKNWIKHIYFPFTWIKCFHFTFSQKIWCSCESVFLFPSRL